MGAADRRHLGDTVEASGVRAKVVTAMTQTLRSRRPWEVPPERPEPDREDVAEGLPPWLAERLFERRIVFLTGRITTGSASTAAASLLSLDAMAEPPEPVQLHLSAPDGDLDAVFTVIDAIDSLRCQVRAVATAQVGGAAVGVLAAAHRRLAYPHARFRLAEPNLAGMNGTADDVARAAGRHLRALEDLVLRIAGATGQPRSRVEDDLSAGRLLDAEQARDYGLVHEVRGPGA
jgi:ATP-dependent Clp protease, protease subunit